jgi:hypothetical protein
MKDPKHFLAELLNGTGLHPEEFANKFASAIKEGILDYRSKVQPSLPPTVKMFEAFVDYSLAPTDTGLPQPEQYEFWRHIDRHPGPRQFALFHYSSPPPPDAGAIISEARRWGWRPAIKEELEAFVKADPEVLDQYRVSALGSFYQVFGRKMFSQQHRVGDELTAVWGRYDAFLFVREED